MFLIKLVWKTIKWTLILALTITLIPVVFLGIMYRNDMPDIKDYSNETISLTEELGKSLDEFLLPTRQDKIVFTLNDKAINKTIKDVIIKRSEEDASFNKDYLNPDANEEDRKYAMISNNGMFIGFKGAWVQFSEKEMTIIASVDIKPVSFFTYKTSVKIVLEIESTVDQMTLKVKSINMGNLPSVWIYNMAKWGMLKFGNNDIQEMVQKLLPLGQFDADERQITIKKDEYTKLLDSALDTKENQISKSLLDLVQALDLFKFGFKTEGISFDMELKKLGQTLQIDDSKYTKLESQEAVNNVIMTQLNSTLISALNNINDPTLNLDINEVQLNQILNYYLGDKVIFSKEIEVGTKKFTIETKPIVTVLRENNAIISIRISLKNEAGNEFVAELAVSTMPKIAENKKDLLFEIKDIKVGETNFEVGNEVRAKLLSTIESMLQGSEDVSFENETIVLKDFMEEFVKSGTTVDEVEVLNEKMRFKIRPQNTEVVKKVKEEIKNVLDAITNDPTNNFNFNPDSDTTEEILEKVNLLTQEEQEDLFKKITTELEKNPDINIDEILASFNQN